MADAKHVEILLQGSTVWNKWREEHPDVVPDLVYAELQGTHLVEADLSECNLTRANLVGANLSSANLRDADLSSAKLGEAHLYRANLQGANLTRANLVETSFVGAQLHAVDFTRANLDKAIFVEAQFVQVRLARVDLSSAIGLELVVHIGPSSIDVDTLTLSQGQIPEVFLRGCGVTPDFINAIRLLARKPVEFHSCFISYSHADKDFAHSLYDFLQGHGLNCWLDAHQVPLGGEILEELDRGIKLWDKVLLCGSENSLTSWWVDEEIDRAFAKEERLMKERGKKVLALIPLNLDGYMFKGWQSAKAGTIKKRLAGDFKGWEVDKVKMQQNFELVLRALRTDGGREEPPKSLL